jgi:hypothetical protein
MVVRNLNTLDELKSQDALLGKQQTENRHGELGAFELTRIILGGIRWWDLPTFLYKDLNMPSYQCKKVE